MATGTYILVTLTAAPDREGVEVGGKSLSKILGHEGLGEKSSKVQNIGSFSGSIYQVQFALIRFK